MGFWSNKDHRTASDEAEDLSYHPSEGPRKMWILGVALALLPFLYGIHSLQVGQTRLFGRHGVHLDLEGLPGFALSLAYMFVGLFIHFHWFWGLHPRLYPWSPLLKIPAVLGFLAGFGYALYTIIFF